ncbi:porin family protein [Dysgonomonas sp. 520]|uniref:porin family protein n=1 Tax=Dysgonomonas sp. 520 TaxID=2302931 RepID=UPI0013D7BD91|nr:porin family protein [Dysgonomonas sp. 520]NDW10314.1 PorT family protein [Dysgonomonas sp. 520]
MKIVIKSCMVAMALLLSTSAYALLPFGFGIHAGMNTSNVGGDVDDTKAKVGYQVGATVDFTVPIIGIFAESGVSLTTKGFKQEVGDKTYSTNAMYLQVPLYFGYKISALNLLAVKFKAGPYWAYGIGGKYKDVNGKKHDTFGDDGFKKNDFGLTAAVGGEVLGKLNVNIGYDFGLTNISQVDDYKVRNRNAYITVGYKF